MRSSWMRWAFASSLCLWLLVSHVYVQFTPVRRKLVKTPQSGLHNVSVVLEGVDAFTDSQLALVCVVRNQGATPLVLSVSVGDYVRRQVGVAPGTTSRIDLAWPRPERVRGVDSVDFTGNTGTWTLEYLELANLHGFTRGAVDLLILPAGQGFGRAPAWWLLVFACGALLLSRAPTVRWPRWLRIGWGSLAAAIAVAFVAIGLSPLLSPFRVVLSSGTFLLGAFVFAAPRLMPLAEAAQKKALASASPLNALARPLRAVPWPLVLAVVSLAAYTVFVISRVGAYAGASDSSGYMNSARLLEQGRTRTPMRLVAGIPASDLPSFAYVPLGFRPRGKHEMAPTYPIGLPLTVLATSRLIGWGLAPNVLMVSYTLAGIALMCWLARVVGLSWGWTALGTLMLATSQQYLFSSLTMMSDTPALVWTAAAVLLAWRSRTDERWAALAGVVFSFSVLVRPTDILALAPVAVCLGLSLRHWALFGAGGAPGAALLLLYNRSAYGSAFESGYGSSGHLFTFANVPLSVANYAAWLPVVLTPLVVLAAGLPLLWRRSPRLVALLVLWILPFAVVYAFYYFTHETWWYLRFLLPIFPPLIAGTLLVARALLEWRPRIASIARSRAGATLLGLATGVFILAHNIRWERHLHGTKAGEGERVYLEVTDWARAHLPANSAAVAMQASGALFYYTDIPILRWDRVGSRGFKRVTAALEAQRQPLYAVVFNWEVEQQRALSKHLPGRWTAVGTVRDATFWRFDGPSARGAASRRR